MKVTIHQPEHLVWLGFLDKVSHADKYIILDSVQFRKNYFQNRNRIRTHKGWSWVTVPIKQHALSTPIKDVLISYDTQWSRRYLGGITEAYRQTKYFDEFFPVLSDIINVQYKTIAELNNALLQFLFHVFGINTPYVYSSEMSAGESGATNSDLIVALCKEVCATEYLSGPSGRDYLDFASFENAGIQLTFHSFEHPVYSQMSEPFVPGMSSVDLLFNHGKEGACQILFPNL